MVLAYAVELLRRLCKAHPKVNPAAIGCIDYDGEELRRNGTILQP